MLYVYVRGVMYVVFSVCIMTRGAVGARVMASMSISSCRCCMFVSCVPSCASSQYCIMHDMQFVNAGRGCKRQPYGKGIL